MSKLSYNQGEQILYKKNVNINFLPLNCDIKKFFYFGTNSGYSLPFGVKVVIIDQRFVFDPGIAGKVVSMIQTQEAEKKGYYGFSKNLDQIKKIYFMKNLTGQKYICRVQFDDGKTVHFIQTIGFLDDLEILFKKIALDKIVE